MNTDRFYFRRFFRKPAPKAPVRKRLLETLEDRVLYDAAPVVTVDAAPETAGTQTEATPMISEEFQVAATFDNAGDADGYGPFVDVKLARGIDLTDDPKYLGAALQVVGGVDNSAGLTDTTYTHAYTGEVITVAAGEEYWVYDLPFGSFVVDQPQAEILFTAITDKTEGALVDNAMNIEMRGGFRYGQDALDNPGTDPAILGPTSIATITPSVWSVTKDLLEHEDETATGENFPNTWQLTIDVADGETINNVHLRDVLPDNVDYLAGSLTISSGAFSIQLEPDAANYAGGILDLTISQIIGAVGTDVTITYQTYTPQFQGTGDVNGNGVKDPGDYAATTTPVINPTAGAAVTSPNGVDATADYDPDGAGILPSSQIEELVGGPQDVPLTSPNTDTLIDRSLAIQKGVTGGGSVLPGDELTYNLNFQVSDYFQFQNLVIVDTLGDGQIFDPTTAPSLDWSEGGANFNGFFTVSGTPDVDTSVAGLTVTDYGNFVVLHNSTTGSLASNLTNPGVDARADGIAIGGGETVILFFLSDQMIAMGGGAMLVGGRVNGANNGGTQGTITYKSDVQEDYINPNPGNSSIDLDDVITSGVTISGDVVEWDNVTVGSNVTDNSGTELVVPSPNLDKQVYAVNGMVGAPAALSPGDSMSYVLTLDLPTSDVENLIVTDFLPLPKFDAAELTSVRTISETQYASLGMNYVPPTGMVVLVFADEVYDAKFGAGTHTGAIDNGTLLPTAGGLAATVGAYNVSVFTTGGGGVTASANSFSLNIGSYDVDNSAGAEVAIYFTVTASDTPMADGLLLTNQLQASYGNTGGTALIGQDIVQVIVQEPVVNIHKGVVASTQGPGTTVSVDIDGDTFIDDSITFNDVGTNGFTGTIDTQELAEAIGSLDLELGTLPDAGDVVRFAIVVQNTGRADAFDVTLQDTIPNSYNNAYANAGAFVAGTNFQVYDGAGNLLTAGADYTLTWNDATNTFTVQLTDAATGALAAGKATNGDPLPGGLNSIVVLYDLTVLTAAQASSTVTNTATLTNYAGTEGGEDHTTSDREESASVVIDAPAFVKVLTSTEINETGNNALTQAVIGELVTYTLTITVPEGTTLDARIIDTLPPGMSFVDIVSVNTSGGVTVQTPPSTGTGPANVTLGNVNGGTADQLTFNLGDVTNTNTDNAATETITIVYRAVVVNTNTVPSSTGNQAGTVLGTSATLDYTWTDDAVGGATGAAEVDSAAVGNVTVVEPHLNVDKQASTDNVTYSNTISNVDAGDTVYFRIVITNDGTVPAYDISLSDQLPTFLGGATVFSVASSGVVAVAGDFSISGGNLLTLTPTGLDLAVGASITIVVQGTLTTAVEPNQSINNDAVVKWSSMDGTVVNRSIHNAASDERDGADANPNTNTDSSGTNTTLNNYAHSDRSTITIANPTPVKTVVATSEAHTAGTDVVVGEIVRYRIVWQLPEGTTTSLAITDNLPAGLQFINDGTALIAFVSNGGTITSNAAGLTGGSLAVVGSSGSVTPTFVIPSGLIQEETAGGGYTNGENVIFNLGTVTNAESDGNGEFVVIEFNALVMNVASNIAGAQPANSVTVRRGATTLQTSADQTVTVVEPTLNVTKTASAANGDAGDAFYYTITIQNTGTVDAFNVSLEDVLSQYFNFYDRDGDTVLEDSDVIEIMSGAATVGDFSLSATTNDVSKTLTTSGSGFSLLAGATVELRVHGVLSNTIPTNISITNTADVEWTSLPGDTGTAVNPTGSVTPGTSGSTTGERTGTGGVNDYADSSAVTTTAVNNVTIAKSVVTTSLGGDTALVTPGELVTYRVTVTLPEAVLSGLTIQDFLPSGMAYVPGTVVLEPGTFLGTGLADPTVTDTSAGTAFSDGADLYFNFASITVTGDNDTTNNTFSFTYQAVVLDVAGNDGVLPGQTTLTNSANHNNGSGTTFSGTISAPAITVQEPNLAVANAIVISGAVDAGATFTYTITVNPTANATSGAYEVALSEILPPEFGTLSLTAATIADGATSTDVLGSFSLTGNTLSTTAGVTLLLNTNGANDQVLTLTITGVLTSAVAPGQEIETTTSLAYSNYPGDQTAVGGFNPNSTVTTDHERDYEASTTEDVTIAAAAFSKSLVSTSQAFTTGSNVAIGETVTYALLVTLPEGTTPDLSILDRLPAGLQYVSSSVVTTAAASGGLLTADFNGTVPAPTVSGGATSGADVGFTFGSIAVAGDNTANNNSFVIFVTALVENVSGNQSGTSLDADATFDITGDGATVFTAPDVTVTVVEPRVTVTQAITTSTAGLDAGDSVTYEITIDNLAGNGATADAFDVAVSQLLAAGLTITAIGSPTLAGGATTETALSGTGTSALAGTFDIPLGGSVVFTVTAIISDATVPGQALNSDVNVAFTSLNGASVNERDGSDVTNPESNTLTGNLDNYAVGDDDSITTAGAIGVAKAVDKATAVIGEILTYTVTVTVGEGTTTVFLNDTLPAGVEFVEDSADLTLPVGWTITGFDIDSVNQTLVVINPGDADAAATLDTDTFTFTYQVRVLDVVGNSNGVDLTNDVEASADLNNDGDEADVGETDNDSETTEVLEPDLVITKSNNDADDIVSPGQTVTYTIVLAHSGDSTATAFDVSLTDAVPAGMTLVAGSINIATAGTFTGLVDNSTGANIDVTVASLGTTGTITITYSVTVDLAPVPGTGVDNNTRVTFSSLTGGVPEERTYEPDATDETHNASTDPRQDTDRVTIGTGTVSNFVWFDQDGDGVQDAAEAGIAGVRVFVDIDSDGVYDSDIDAAATTDADGAYTITGLAPGSYVVRIDASTLPDAGSPVATYDLDGTGTPGVASVTLTNGQTRTDVDFGYRGTGSIGNTVWLDLDGGGTQNGIEPGTPGVTLSLIWDADGNGIDVSDPVIATTITDAAGNYTFTGLLSGNYRVVVTDDNGVLEDATATYDLDGTTLTPTGRATINGLAVGGTSTGADFGYQGAAVIGDRVWNDLDGDGTQDGGEFGIGGLTINAYRDVNEDGLLDGGDLLIATTTTDSDGAYTFEGLIAGDYLIEVDAPPASTTPTYDLDDGATQTPTTADVAARTLGSDEQADDLDFGYIGQASIGDYVWFDQDGDGVQDAGEPPMEGVRVLIDVDGNGVYTAGTDAFETTDASGFFEFTGLIAGTYTVIVDTNTLPVGLREPTWDRDDTNVDPDGAAIVTVGATGTPDDVDFGFQGEFVISGVSYHDRNGDGDFDDGADTGIGGVTIELIWDNDSSGTFNAGDFVITTTTSAADGTYEFSDLIIGDYLIRETQPAGFGAGSENGANLIAVPIVFATGSKTDQNFGNTTGSIGGTVFRDDDNDGVQDAGEDGIEGADVTLEWTGIDGIFGTADDQTVTVGTDADGDYLFDYTVTDDWFTGFGDSTAGLLSTGSYRITETQPADYLDGADVTGNAGGSAGTVDEGLFPGYDGRGGADEIDGIQITAGQNASAYTFADFEEASLSGFVYVDLDGDGTFDSFESGLPGVTVTLTGTNDIGELIDIDLVTGADGSYTFDGLRPSDATGYTLTQTQPAGHSDGGDTLGSGLSGANDAGDDSVSDVFSGIVLVNVAPGNNTGTGYNFGELFDFAPVKSVVGTDVATTAGNDVVIGEVVRYSLVINVPHGTLEDFQLQDYLPAGLRFLDNGTAAVTYTGAVTSGVAAGLLPGAAISTSATTDADTYASGTDVFFKLGTVVNAGAGLGGEFITIEFDAVVVNEAGNQAAATHDNTFGVRFDTTGDDVADDTGGPSNTITTTVVEAGIVVTKTVSDDTPHLGDTVTYAVNVLNEDTATGATAYDLVLTDVLPADVLTALSNITVTLYNMNGSAGTGDDVLVSTLVAGVDYTITSGLTGWTINLAQLDQDQRIEVTYDATVSTTPTDVLGTDGLFGGGDDSYDNTITATWTSLPGTNTEERTGDDPVGDDDYTTGATLTTTVVGAGLNLDKDDGLASVSPGDTWTYTITINNVGTDTGTGVVLTDILPEEVTLGAVRINGVVTAVTLTADGFTVALPDVAAGDDIVVEVDVTLAAAVSVGFEELTNTASVTHDDVDPTPDNNTDDDIDVVTAAPEIAVVKEVTSVNNGAVPVNGDGDPIIAPGDTLIYTIVITNTGDQHAFVNIVDTFPGLTLDLANAIIDDADTGVGAVIDLDAGTITWNGVGLDAGETITITIEAEAFDPQLEAIDDFTNGVVVTNVNPANPTEDGTTVEDDVLVDLDAFPDLVVTKTNSTDEIGLDETFTYTITVTNTGDQNATGVTVVDSLPPYVELIDASGNYTWDPIARTITWTSAVNPELLVVNGRGSETLTFTVTVKLPINSIAFGELTNTARAFDDSSNGPDLNPDDNEATQTTGVLGFLYDTSQNFSVYDREGENHNDDFHLGLPIDIYRDAILPIAPIYSGAAEPGATLEVVLYNANGDVLGRQSVIVDTGGNWMASFPGVIVKDYPQSVVITQTPPAAQVEGAAANGYNMRPYYATAINAGHFFRENLNVTRISEQTAEATGSAFQEAINNPIGFNLSASPYETLASPGHPTGR